MTSLRPFLKTLAGRPVAVFGLGTSGLSVVRALKAAGAEVLAWDDNEDSRKKARRAGAKIREPDPAGLAACGVLVLTPGVPLHYPRPHPVVQAARAAGTEIIGDIEILHRCAHGRRVIGVTGTNGKSTTTALIGHILRSCGVRAAAGGNLGTPALDLRMPPKSGALVLELSSYQLDLCPSFAPEIAVLLNVTPDHIDRHGTLERYAAAKARIFRGTGAAVIAVDDDLSRDIAAQVEKTGLRRVVRVSGSRKSAGGVFVKGHVLYDDTGGQNREIGSLEGIPALRGAHNMQNAAAAYAVSRLMKIPARDILSAIKTYPGLPHRQFPVRVINGVTYINDSKATNAEAAGKALASYTNIYWILGGRPKEGGLDGLESLTARIRYAFLIGEAAADFEKWLKKMKVPCSVSRTLDVAVSAAHEMAQRDRGRPGGAGVVLLSPACASFDQFRSFEHRGDEFTKLVGKLKQEARA